METKKEQIEVIGIPTANRPLELDRMLTSFILNVTRYGRLPEFVVSDDSQNNNLPGNAEVISKHQKTYAGKITHLHFETRKKLADDIANDSDVPPAAARFAVCGDDTSPVRIGAPRNAILLYAAGKKILFVDDD